MRTPPAALAPAEELPIPRPARGEALARPDLQRLYQEHAPFVRRAVGHLAGPGLDVDDLVQEVFVQAARAWASFQARSSERTWLYGVALGVVRNARRRARFRRFFGLERAQNVVDPEPTPEEQLERARAVRTLRRLLEALPEKQRTVLVLFEFEGQTGQEIAQIVGCSVQVVWNRLFQARRALARLYPGAADADRAPNPGRKP